MKTAQLQKLISPRSVTVVGASRSKEKVGGVIFANIYKGSNKVRVYPVNPNANKILGEVCYDTVLELPEIVDLAIIALPSDLVDEAVEDCGIKGIKNVVIISSGYRETGKDGLEKEIVLQNLQRKYQLNILGPNCLGLINNQLGINMSFAKTSKKSLRGKITLISQSGAVGTGFLDWAEQNNVEVGKFISLGNKLHLNENDFLSYCNEDKHTSLVLFYLEDFYNGREFYELAKLVTQKKPVVVLKPGKSEVTQKAMSAHTGALSSSDKVIEQALKDCGVIRVESLEDLFAITKLLEWQPKMKGNRVALVTNAGGVAIETIDQLTEQGLEVKELSQKTQTRLSKHLNTNASSRNPIDLLGDALADDYKKALKEILKDDSVDIVHVLLTPQFMTESLLTAKYVNFLADKHDKMVIASFMGGEKVRKAIAYLDKEKLPHFSFPNDAARVLGEVWRWQKYLKTRKSSRLNYPTMINPDLKVKVKGEMLDEETTKSLLKKFGINTLGSGLFDNLNQIRKAENRLKFPLVAKLKHPKLVHKTDVKAVKLPIYKFSELNKAVMELDQLAKKLNLEEYQFELQQFIFQKLELILGVSKDEGNKIHTKEIAFETSKGFGHVIVLGAGGIYTEIMNDTSLKLIPVMKSDVLEMINSIKVGGIIFGARSQQYNHKALIEMIMNLSKMIEKNSNITSMDINPVFLTEHDAYAADVKVFVN